MQINIIPESCEIHLDRHVVPGENPERVLPAVEQILDKLRQTDDQLKVAQIKADHMDWPLDPSGRERFAAVVQQTLGQMALPNDLITELNF